MDSFDKALTYIFLLSLALLALVYYVGLKSDADSVFAGLKSIMYAATGRDSTGKFVGYPALAKAS